MTSLLDKVGHRLLAYGVSGKIVVKFASKLPFEERAPYLINVMEHFRLQITRGFRWKFPPVDIRTFIESEDLLNKPGIIYPKILACMAEANNGNYVETVNTGGIGCGKTTFALYSQAYQLYILSCMVNPQAEFGLDPSSEVMIVFQSLNSRLAKTVDYQRFRNMIAASPYFKSVFPFRKDLESELLFPNRIIVRPLSGDSQAAIGQNVIGGIIDECFAAGTLVETVSGKKAIEKIKPGEKVASFDAAGRKVFKRVLQSKNNGRKQVLKIDLASGKSIVVTPNHPIATFNGWVPAGSLFVGSEVYCAGPERSTSLQDLARKIKGSGADRGEAFVRYQEMLAENDGSERVRPEEWLDLSSVHGERIVGFSSADLAEVFNLEVEGTHNYVAAGVIAHNCNFMQVVEQSKQADDGGVYDQAKAIYNSIVNRRKSRFMTKGRLAGLLCLVSSKRYPGEFTDRKQQEARDQVAEKGYTNIYVYDKRIWDVKPDGSYTDERFYVFCGDFTRKPRILDAGEVIEDEDRHLTVAVPVEFLDDFKRNILDAIRDVAGMATLAMNPYIGNPEAVAASFGKTISILSRDDADFVDTSVRIYPDRIKNKDEPRFAHVDLSLSGDSTGVAVGYVSKFVCMNRNGNKEYLPQIVYDFVLEVKPPKTGEIEFSKIRSLFYKLREIGLNLKWITYDSYQSTDSLQILATQGFTTGIQSMDTDPRPYDFLKAAFYDARVSLPEQQKALSEIVRLERDPKKGKVDHPADSSKDLSDAIAGVAFGLTMQREIWHRHNVGIADIPSELLVSK
jgi:hypothetical protein